MEQPAAQRLREELRVGCGVARPVCAPRGMQLRCRGWLQEAVLRMPCNKLDRQNSENLDYMERAQRWIGAETLACLAGALL
jgi:hypothetical protein